MSAIGDYVHLTYTGYVKGPEEGSGKPPFFDNYGAAVSNRQRKFNNWVNKQKSSITQDMEKETQKLLNLFKNFKEHKGNVSTEEKKMVEDVLTDMQEQMDNKYFRLDLVNAAAAGIMQRGGFEVGQYTGEKASQTTQTSAINNINNQLKSLLNETLDEVSTKLIGLTSGELNLKNVKTEINKTQQNINNFINQLQKEQKTLNVSDFKNTSQSLNMLFQNLKQVIQNNKGYDNIGIEDIINTMIDGISAGLAANQYKGDISEAMVAVAAQRLAAFSGSTIQREMVRVSGQDRSQRGLNTSYFSSDIDWESALGDKKFRKPFGDFIVSADAVQDKVDIEIELSTGRHAYVSAKNYSLKSLARGVSNRSASFLTLIQNENDEDLINHYLNLNAVHGNWKSLRSNAIEINNLIRKITLAKLITGYNTVTGANGATMKEANVFAVFNSNDYTVKYYDMGDVLLKIFSGNRYQNMKIPQFLYNANIKSSVDYRTRISNLIKQLNVSVSYTLKEEELKN